MLTALQSHGHGDMSVKLYVMNILCGKQLVCKTLLHSQFQRNSLPLTNLKVVAGSFKATAEQVCLDMSSVRN